MMIRRRGALGLLLSAGAVSGGGLLGLDVSRGMAQARPPETRPLLPRPAVLAPGAELVATPARAAFATGGTTFGYNGTTPGPLIRVRRGETFRQTIRNDLTEETSFHWHGLAVPTDMDGQPQDALPPGATAGIVFPILQRAGLNWYHPHPHGATGRQAWSGMAGFFIVEDEEEDALNLPSGADELIFALRDAKVDGALGLVYEMNPDGHEGDFPLVNGVAWPRTTLNNRLVRLRILNGANARVFRLTSEAPLIVIGNDGGLIDRPHPVDMVEMSSGERVDLLMDLRDVAPGTKIGLHCAAAGWQLLEIEVTAAEPTGWKVPETLSVIEPLVHDGAEPDRTFVFQNTDRINDELFDMTKIAFALAPGTVERWRFASARGAPHPVHVHGAHFQVVGGQFTDGTPRREYPWERGWKDTVHVRTHESVDVLVRFDHYEGRYLLHCHKLEHEDHGMMLNFLVDRDPVEAMRRADLEEIYGPICVTET
ncbi:hypothetical protein D2T29_10960 [Sinirhodobacter populi]|uniref:Copper oxidase n=1 Tax=Paenirhodobacter populi TaxID=2306993 RepID=A0A443KEJ0_9RHOB|nr:multicopper oxidase domain-containing protein [Sinirhodobacter populi]RWR31237.1 hypothetical protein D2T29_10960 [Sinirhodobacter populi]